MKKLYAVLSLTGMMAATNLHAGFDGTLTLSQGPLSFGNGGAFTAVTSGLGTFQTFCIEYNEEFAPGIGNTYAYNMNTGAVAGGVGGQDATDPHTGLTMDNISIGTAYLYSQFRSGGLVVSTAQQAGNLQDAIWYLEGEITFGQLSTMNGADGTADYNLAVSAAGALGKGVFDDSQGAYGVIAMNLFNGPGATQVVKNGVTYNLNQDQLAIVPEATTMVAGALLLLPFGASTFRILRKSRKA